MTVSQQNHRSVPVPMSTLFFCSINERCLRFFIAKLLDDKLLHDCAEVIVIWIINKFTGIKHFHVDDNVFSKLLKPLEIKECPFHPRPRTNERPHWVKPKLVAQIKKVSRAAPAMWDGSAEDELLLIRGKPSTPSDRGAPPGGRRC